jgi:hypothetical protein
MNRVVFASSGRAYMSVLIYLRIVGKALIVLKGLMTLRMRKAFKFTSKEKNSMML